MGPDWPLLPAELVQLISEKIILMEQYGNFRLVCRQYRRACPPHPSHLIGQIPWLWLPRDSTSSSSLSYYDFSTSKIYKFNLPDGIEIRSAVCSRGWILIEKELEISLFNPITGEMKINCLPSLAAPPIILEFARNEKTLDPLPFDHQSMNIRKVILTSSASDENCIVVAEFSYDWELGFCRAGDSCWTILKLMEFGRGSRTLSDFMYKNSLVYAMNDEGRVTVYDIQSLSQKILIGNLACSIRDNFFYQDLYLVLGEGELDGIPLAVRYKIYIENDVDGVEVSRDEIEVCKCVNERGQNRWSIVKDIGNAVMILGHSSQTVPLANIKLNGWEENHIFHDALLKHENSHVTHIKKLNIMNGSITEVCAFPSTRSGCISWFTPSLG